MCLYPKKIQNRKYTATKKNGGIIPDPPIIGPEKTTPIYDQRVLFIEVPCGQCIECRNTKAREWQVRLAEEIKIHKYNYFITLTFAPKELDNLLKKTGKPECNAIAGYAVRHMLERYRKDNKTSLKHWLITELGHEKTERLHMHGLIFADQELQFGSVDNNNLRTWKYWKYGYIYVGEYVNTRTISYISKYITKIDTDHKGFIGQILASPGIGKSFINKLEITGHDYKYRPGDSSDYYRLENGSKVKLPSYYKKKLYSEEDREKMWRDFMDRNTVSILGQDHNKRTCNTLTTIRDNARDYNMTMGYGDDSGEWKKKPYNVTKRMLQQVERNKRIQEMHDTVFNAHLERPGKVTLEETFELKKLKFTADDINIIIARRGRDF